MRSIWLVKHVSVTGEVLFEDRGPNIFHDEGEEWLLDVAFTEVLTPPTDFYLGCDDRDGVDNAAPAEADTLASLVGEPDGTNGYSRQAVTSNDTDWTVDQPSGDYRATSKTVTFTASGGPIGPLTTLFLATSSDNTGRLLCTRALSQERNLADGESLECSMYIEVGE